MNSDPSELAAGQESLVTCLSSDGVQLRANCHRLNRHSVVFEILTPQVVVRSSEALTEFKITANRCGVYDGRAIVKSVIQSNTTVVCEATLEDSWIDPRPPLPQLSTNGVRSEFAQFLGSSSHRLKILPEFKLVVADLQAFLLDLREWAGFVEIGSNPTESDALEKAEGFFLREVDRDVQAVITGLFDRFEHACDSIEPESRPAHAHYVKRLLHPLVLCAPFMYRSFQKPLGYAGDYEMVNMMMSDPYRGDSAYAKLLNSYFLSTPPVVAHQHRVAYLTRMLEEEVCRASAESSGVKIFNLGCGPALEIQDFIVRSEFSNRAQFTLLDFNDETINYVSNVLQGLKTKHRRSTSIQCNKKSVVQLLKESARLESTLLGSGYDVIYCAGLFDYLTAPVCEKLMSLFYGMLSPGGLLVATNVYSDNPSINWMEYSVDWHLIYRDRTGMMAICPNEAPADACVLKSDPTGLNLLLEVRKPAHA